MEIVFSVFTALYGVCLVWLIFQWRSIPVFKVKDLQKSTADFITVIVPVRNEAENILHLLQDLSVQKAFPADQFEVLVVDDHSEDQTSLLVERYCQSCSFQLRLLPLNLPKEFTGSHKKLAITQAVAEAKGNIMITTDGDCRVGAYWLASFTQFFEQKQAVFVSGPVTFHHEANLFHHLQTIEFASLIGTGAASMHAKTPNMCNGANLGFTKEAFMAVNGYVGTMHIPSGDDEFLMQKMFRQYPDHLYFMKNTEATVHTYAKSGLREFYHQRRRWAGKWKLHKNAGVAMVAGFVFIYHSFLLIASCMALLGQYSCALLAALLLLKFSLEFFLLNDVLRFLKKRMSILNFILLEFIYSAYVVFVGICANFGGYTWKNRYYK